MCLITPNGIAALLAFCHLLRKGPSEGAFFPLHNDEKEKRSRGRHPRCLNQPTAHLTVAVGARGELRDEGAPRVQPPARGHTAAAWGSKKTHGINFEWEKIQ